MGRRPVLILILLDLADNVEQDQTARTCSLILLCTLCDFLSKRPYPTQFNRLEFFCEIENNSNRIECNGLLRCRKSASVDRWQSCYNKKLQQYRNVSNYKSKTRHIDRDATVI